MLVVSVHQMVSYNDSLCVWSENDDLYDGSVRVLSRRGEVLLVGVCGLYLYRALVQFYIKILCTVLGIRPHGSNHIQQS